MNTSRFLSHPARWFALLAFAALAALAGAALAQPQPQDAGEPQADPPARVGAVTAAEGSVVFAPAGETEWIDLPRNRPVVGGDRLWTDDGGRAEVNFGSSVLHMDARTFVEVIAIDGDALQLAVNEGSVNARTRELRAGDNFEISTPQLALRATQPGDWRIDVDPQQGYTRVTAHSGVALLYGAGGNVQQIVAGQQLAFAGRDLQLANVPPAADDGFGQWALARNQAQDRSLAARYVPRDVVAAPELDAWGSWSQDADYGTVWYPQVTATDWAPYRYGRWEWIAPWGWTWIDDAPWGFAPFHYGRWTMIRSRWAWVPGPLGRHAVYAPALVAFVGGGPSVGWYPLAPGEIWEPWWHASPAYVRNVNRYLVRDSRGLRTGAHLFGHRADVITAARADDFNRGRWVAPHRGRVREQDFERVQPGTPPVPARQWQREIPREQARGLQPQPRHFEPRERADAQQQPAPRERIQRDPPAQRVEAARRQPAAREIQREQAVQQRRERVEQRQQEHRQAAEQRQQQRQSFGQPHPEAVRPQRPERAAPPPHREQRAPAPEQRADDAGRGRRER